MRLRHVFYTNSVSLVCHCVIAVADSDYEVSSSTTPHRSESAQEMKGDVTPAAPFRMTSTTPTTRTIRPSAIAPATLDRPSRRGKQGDPKRKARRPPSRICKHEGCEQYVVDQGLCVRHGVCDCKHGRLADTERSDPSLLPS